MPTSEFATCWRKFGRFTPVSTDSTSARTLLFIFVQSAAAKASNGPESPDSDSEDAAEAAAGSSGQVDPGAADQAEDQLSAPRPAGLDGEKTERNQDGDELQQVCDPRLNPKYVVV